MDVLAGLQLGFQNAITLHNIYLCFLGCLWGSMVGVLPGVGPLAGIALLILDSLALTWVAMRAALTAKSPNRASASAVWRVLILPWVIFAAVSVVLGLWASATRQSLGWKPFLHLWLWLGVLTDLAFGLPAWWQLRTRFRELALQRFSAPRAEPE